MNNKLRRGSLLAEAYTKSGSVNNDLSNPNPNYLTIVALEDGLTASLSVNDVEYSIDGNDNWTILSAGTASPAINKNHYISFRGNLTPTSSVGVGTFTILKSCNLTGNCNSLLFGDDAVNNNSLSGKNYAFYKLFYNCTTIKNVSSSFLPAITLSSRCYTSMFYRCSSLITSPELPATTLATHCYYYMFYDCTSLTTVPSILPSNTLISYCYQFMFQNCTSLTRAPKLPATTLVQSCYYAMFSGCTSLTTAPELPATKLANYCYYAMFSNCKSLTTAYALPATTLKDYCYSSMFDGCSSLTAAPELPATTLTTQCYYYMFRGCSSLTAAPELPATTLVDSCYISMFLGCSKLNYIKALFTTTPSSSYTDSWVYGVASSGTFVKNKNATWNATGTSSIPSGWTVQTA